MNSLPMLVHGNSSVTLDFYKTAADFNDKRMVTKIKEVSDSLSSMFKK